MSNLLSKTKINNYTNELLDQKCSKCGHSQVQDMHFNIPVKERDKTYPSCYQYNVLVMLAKRLVKEESEREKKIFNPCINRWHLDRKLVKRIIEC